MVFSEPPRSVASKVMARLSSQASSDLISSLFSMLASMTTPLALGDTSTANRSKSRSESALSRRKSASDASLENSFPNDLSLR